MASRENSTATVPSFVPSCVLVSSWITQNPFVRPLKPNLLFQNSVIRELRCSFTSTAEKCLRFLHLFASENPVLKRIISFSCDFSRHLTQANLCLPVFIYIPNLLVRAYLYACVDLKGTSGVHDANKTSVPRLRAMRAAFLAGGCSISLEPKNAFSSTAAALPAELPKTEASQGSCTPNTRFTNFTTSQKKWMRRLYGNKPQSTTGSN
ncbi:uncharacterized protein LOC110662240 [Hevea brasiliensis]|uniref:uncharacterized protein LOC110662240 n=1 Tax=Hevea brasiliensis TaxID=3981 RepID=UPI0025E0EF30|nr:uncharacterized protein LOC110662240 [Hevea brasiliensis]